MPRTPVTARDVTKWLKDNPTINGKPTRIPDAVQATGYKGPTLKIKDGNLSTNRSKIRLAKRGDNGDYNRAKARKIRPAINAEERRQQRRLRDQRAKLNKIHGRGSYVIDHVYSLAQLANDVAGQGPRLRGITIAAIEAEHGPVGDRPGNYEIVPNGVNEQRRQQANIPPIPKLNAPDKITTPKRGGVRFRPQIQTSGPTGMGISLSSLSDALAPVSRSADTGLLDAPHIFLP